jgi:hypothetical protein
MFCKEALTEGQEISRHSCDRGYNFFEFRLCFSYFYVRWWNVFADKGLLVLGDARVLNGASADSSKAKLGAPSARMMYY